MACICVFRQILSGFFFFFLFVLFCLFSVACAAKDENRNASLETSGVCVCVCGGEMELQTQAVPGLSGKGQYLDLAGKAYKPSYIDWLLLCVCLTLFPCP